MEKEGRKCPNRLADSCKRLSVNRIAAFSRLSWSSLIGWIGNDTVELLVVTIDPDPPPCSMLHSSPSSPFAVAAAVTGVFGEAFINAAYHTINK